MVTHVHASPVNTPNRETWGYVYETFNVLSKDPLTCRTMYRPTRYGLEIVHKRYHAYCWPAYSWVKNPIEDMRKAPHETLRRSTGSS